jgi:undecaprenyl-diphosphatase
VDWTIFHAMNAVLRHNEGGQDAAQTFNAWAIFVIVVVTGGMWFLARPGGSVRSKLAALSAAISGGLALLVNVVLGQLWFHDRPFVDHPHHTLLVIRHAADNSFPSDHASLAFAVAFAVLAYHRKLGLLLLVAAGCVGADRIFIGVHYPLDVLTSILVGLACALVVTRYARPYVEWGARQLSKISDPVVALATARIASSLRHR